MATYSDAAYGEVGPVNATNLTGVEVPDATPLFLAVLGGHVIAGLVAVIAGVVAMLAAKRAARHPRVGRVYLSALLMVAGTAAVLAALRWPRDVHLLVLGVCAAAAALVGWRVRRRHRAGWRVPHLVAMGSSYVLLLTAFYVDNGPQLPLWRYLPAATFWVLPALVGAPLMVRAARRYRSFPLTDAHDRPG